MPNLYGIANPIGIPLYATTIGGGNISCPSGVETNVITANLPAPTVPGSYFPACFLFACYTLGALAPGNVIYALRIGGGSDISSSGTAAAALVPNATLTPSYLLYAPSTLIQNPSGITVFNISCNPSGQAITHLMFSTYAFVWWVRGPD